MLVERNAPELTRRKADNLYRVLRQACLKLGMAGDAERYENMTIRYIYNNQKHGYDIYVLNGNTQLGQAFVSDDTCNIMCVATRDKELKEVENALDRLAQWRNKDLVTD